MLSPKTSDCSWPRYSQLAWNTSECYSSSRAECQSEMWQFCLKWCDAVMSMRVGSVPLVQRVHMIIGYFWGGKTQCDIEQMQEEEKGKDSICFTPYLIWYYPGSPYDSSLIQSELYRFTYTNSHTQKIGICQDTAAVVQLLHRNFGYRLDPSFFRLLDWFAVDTTSHSLSAVWFVSQEPSFGLFAHDRHLSCSLYLLEAKKKLKTDQTHYFETVVEPQDIRNCITERDDQFDSSKCWGHLS